MGEGGRDISSACDHRPFFGAVGSRFNEELNTRRIKHVFRGLCPNFARDLLKAIRPCSVEIENVLGGMFSEAKMVSEASTPWDTRSRNTPFTHTHIHGHTHIHAHTHTHPLCSCW